MILIKRTRNLNDIAWPVVEDGPFTPCEPTRWEHIVSSSSWLLEPTASSYALDTGTVDEDIRTGRTKTFSSLDDLILDLDQKE